MKQRRSFFLMLAIVVVAAAIWSVVYLSAPRQQTLDQRVQAVASQLKCPICQGESVADSPSLLAQQMRGVIRQQLQEGKSEQEIIQYFVRSYGEQIVWLPPWQGFSLLAWLVPIGLLLAGVVLIYFTLRDWSALSRSVESRGNDRDMLNSDEAELESYRTQLERELAEGDVLFKRYQTEAQ
ncbi:MAG TPA: cytochrome c-type biogenesis protein CcmH [Ktedonobacteraceae bacterium]|nr:cytochrome c-type biogenesis protein CcmH [Ktedonobacteraceae bacterium]